MAEKIAFDLVAEAEPIYYADDGIDEILSLMFDEDDKDEDEDIYDLLESESEDDTIEPGECEYGGYWYKKAIVSQSSLIAFYEKFGFVEDKKQRKHFGSTPYPCYRKHLTHSSL